MAIWLALRLHGAFAVDRPLQPHAFIAFAWDHCRQLASAVSCQHFVEMCLHHVGGALEGPVGTQWGFSRDLVGPSGDWWEPGRDLVGTWWDLVGTW